MITLFVILLLGFLFSVIGVALKLSWGLIKFLLTVVFFPVILIALVVKGLVVFAVPILVIAGVVLLVRGLTAA